MKILKITTHWSAEEADCVYQLLDAFKEAIWQSYGEEILQMVETMRVEQRTSEEHEDFNDEMPF